MLRDDLSLANPYWLFLIMLFVFKSMEMASRRICSKIVLETRPSRAGCTSLVSFMDGPSKTQAKCLPFFQPSEISPSHHSLSRTTDSTPSMTPASIPACPKNWCIFSMPKWSLRQLFSSMGSTSFPVIQPQRTGTWKACKQNLPTNANRYL